MEVVLYGGAVTVATIFGCGIRKKEKGKKIKTEERGEGRRKLLFKVACGGRSK